MSVFWDFRIPTACACPPSLVDDSSTRTTTAYDLFSSVEDPPGKYLKGCFVDCTESCLEGSNFTGPIDPTNDKLESLIDPTGFSFKLYFWGSDDYHRDQHHRNIDNEHFGCYYHHREAKWNPGWQ